MKLTIEPKGKDFWGRILKDDNLIVDCADSQEKLIEQMAKLVGADVKFTIDYDLQSFFEEFSYLKMSKLSAISGINDSLMRQYATGQKCPSAKQVAKIQAAIEQIIRELSEVKLTPPRQTNAQSNP